MGSSRSSRTSPLDDRSGCPATPNMPRPAGR